MNIFEKMSAITSDITNVAKNLNVGFGKNQYKAVGEADVLAAVKPAEEKHKVYSYPFDREIVESSIIVTKKADGTESRQQFMRIRTVYRFVDMENPSDYIDIITYGDGVDTQDKAPGKAMTYADKYGLLKAYKIITGDDPDQNASEDLKRKERKSDIGKQKVSETKLKATRKLMEEKGLREDYIFKSYKISSMEDLTEEQNAAIVRNIDKAVEMQKAYDEKNGGNK